MSTLATTWDGDGSDYRSVVEQLQALAENEREEFYRRQVFPRSCRHIRDARGGTRDDLLVVPVGTQPYAPILAVLANPSEQVVLLHSRESAQHCREVEVALAPDRLRLQPVLVDPYDLRDIVKKVQDAYEVLRQPEHVVCDQTGGTKITTTALAGLAAVNGWRLSYLRADTESTRRFMFNETVVDLPNPFYEVGGWHRVVAEAAAALGRFDAAARETRLARQNSLASAGYARDEKLFRLAWAYRELDFDRVFRGTRRVLPETCRAVMAQADPEAPPPELLYWVARCHLKEGNKLACEAVLHRVRRDLDLATLQSECGSALKAWKPLDDLVGLGLSRRASR